MTDTAAMPEPGKDPGWVARSFARVRKAVRTTGTKTKNGAKRTGRFVRRLFVKTGRAGKKTAVGAYRFTRAVLLSALFLLRLLLGAALGLVSLVLTAIWGLLHLFGQVFKVAALAVAVVAIVVFGANRLPHPDDAPEVVAQEASVTPIRSDLLDSQRRLRESIEFYDTALAEAQSKNDVKDESYWFGKKLGAEGLLRAESKQQVWAMAHKELKKPENPLIQREVRRGFDEEYNTTLRA